MSNYEQFSQAAVQPLFFEDPEREDALMREIMDPLLVQSFDGQQFSVIHANRDFADSGKPTVILLGPFLGNTERAERKWEVHEYAVAVPDSQIIAVDFVGHGKSDASTTTQRRAVLKDKNLDPVAISQLQAVGTLISKRHSIVIVGDSLGGAIMPAMALYAPELGLSPVALVSHEPAGLDKRTGAGLAKAFYIDELMLQGRYKNDPQGLHLREGYENFKVALRQYGYPEKDPGLYGIYRKDKAIGAMILLRSPLATDRGFDLLDQALETHPDLTAHLVSGALSRISRWRKIEGGVRHLSQTYGDRVDWQLWPFDTHSMGLAHQQPRLALHTRAALGNTE